MRDTSPRYIVFQSGDSFLLEMIAAIHARSTPGSERVSPRAILRYTSEDSSLMDVNLLITAMRSSSLP